MEAASRKLIPIVAILFVLIIALSGIIIWSRFEQGEPVEIVCSTRNTWNGTIYIDGEVNLPGYYPFTYEDTIETLIQSAGGISANFSPDEVFLRLDVPILEQQTQKIDINRAEKWLLEALPGIGEILAQRIIDYRADNGKFSNTPELLRIDGIGTAVYERIKEYITVSD